MKLYKVLGKDYQSIHGGVFDWRPYLDGGWTPRRMPNICVTGYHLVTLRELPDWPGHKLFLAEGNDTWVKEYGKYAYESVRLIREITEYNEELLNRQAVKTRELCSFCKDHLEEDPRDKHPRDIHVFAIEELKERGIL